MMFHGVPTKAQMRQLLSNNDTAALLCCCILEARTIDRVMKIYKDGGWSRSHMPLGHALANAAFDILEARQLIDPGQHAQLVTACRNLVLRYVKQITSALRQHIFDTNPQVAQSLERFFMGPKQVRR